MSAIGATIAYPELATVGDIDNAIASLTFASGKLGVVDLSRSGIYGYDISTEILGLGGHAAHRLPARDAGDGDDEELGRARHGAVLHGAVPRRLHDAAAELRAERAAASATPPITIDDGIEALRIGVAATRAQESGKSVVVADVKA